MVGGRKPGGKDRSMNLCYMVRMAIPLGRDKFAALTGTSPSTIVRREDPDEPKRLENPELALYIMLDELEDVGLLGAAVDALAAVPEDKRTESEALGAVTMVCCRTDNVWIVRKAYGDVTAKPEDKQMPSPTLHSIEKVERFTESVARMARMTDKVPSKMYLDDGVADVVRGLSKIRRGIEEGAQATEPTPPPAAEEKKG